MAKTINIDGFNYFYDFFWFVNKKNPTNADLAHFKYSVTDIFKVWGDGNSRKGRVLAKKWKREFNSRRLPTSQVHLYGKWRKFSARKQKRLEEEIKGFGPPRAPRPSDPRSP